MDDGPDIVTSDKPKNQGRVEWGRKLGKMSKERKKIKTEEKPDEIKKTGCTTSTPSVGLNGIVSVGLIVIAALYYFRKNSSTEQIKTKPIEIEKPKTKSFPVF